MHGEISSPFEHRRLELLHKESLAAYLGKGAVENLVAARRHAKEFNLCPRITVAKAPERAEPATWQAGFRGWR